MVESDRTCCCCIPIELGGKILVGLMFTYASIVTIACVVDKDFREHNWPIAVLEVSLATVLLLALLKPVWISRRSASRAFGCMAVIAISY